MIHIRNIAMHVCSITDAVETLLTCV